MSQSEASNKKSSGTTASAAAAATKLQDLSSAKSGRVTLQPSNDDDTHVPSSFYCPITHSIMKDPVIDLQGNTFDRHAIEEWLQEHHTSPSSRKGLTVQQLVPNRALREAIAEQMGTELPASGIPCARVFCTIWMLTSLVFRFSSTGPGWVVEEDSKHCAVITESKDKEEKDKPDSRAVVDGFLAEIGAALGKNIRLNSNGVSAFTYDRMTFVIEVPEHSASFFVYTTLTEGTSIQEGMLELAMKRNYLQQDTRGGCLGVDPNSGDLIYSYSDRVYGIDSTQFRYILENLIDTSLKFYAEFNGKSAV